jgi:NAD(P)-dependent dehydrogenase (short-subunit alcohol dehydrogenase family)
MIYPETCIIVGANSNIGAFFAHNIIDCVKQLILFYHIKNDRITDLIDNEKVIAIKNDIKDYNDFQNQLHNLDIEINDLSALYFPAVRSVDCCPISDIDLKLMQEIIEVNFIGSVHFLKGIFSLKQEIKSSRIVLLGSNVSRSGLENGSIYAASKAAMANLARSVSTEMGEKNVLINTVSPGPVDTKDSTFETNYLKFRDEYFEKNISKTSLKKLASIDEVSSLIKFLTSFENGHITGEEIFITGGAI